MNAPAQVITLSYNPQARRFEGEVALTRPGGSKRRVNTAVIGSLNWTFESIAREMLDAARRDLAA